MSLLTLKSQFYEVITILMMQERTVPTRVALKKAAMDVLNKLLQSVQS
jgi:hypothetical protein